MAAYPSRKNGISQTRVWWCSQSLNPALGTQSQVLHFLATRAMKTWEEMTAIPSKKLGNLTGMLCLVTATENSSDAHRRRGVCSDLASMCDRPTLLPPDRASGKTCSQPPPPQWDTAVGHQRNHRSEQRFVGPLETGAELHGQCHTRPD
jgi:hypothetical protein